MIVAKIFGHAILLENIKTFLKLSNQNFVPYTRNDAQFPNKHMARIKLVYCYI
jgi:hypothetical protein